MKQHIINKAYKTLMHIYTMPINIRVAHQLCVLTKALQPSFDSCYEMEQKLFSKYGITVQDGQLVCTPVDDTQEARVDADNRMRNLLADWDVLHNTEVDLDIDPLRVSFDDMNNVCLTPAEVDSLMGFVEFV